MEKEINVMVEFNGDDGFACQSLSPIGDYERLVAEGGSAHEAKDNFLATVEACGKANPGDDRYKGLTFHFEYDLRAFFNYFSFINASEVARLGGMNPSLLRQYTCGAKNPSSAMSQRIAGFMRQLIEELSAAKIR